MRDAARRIEPVGGRGLAAAGQCRQRVVGDVGLRQADARRERPGRFQQHGRFVERLLDVDVGDARDQSQARGHRLRVGEVGRLAAPGNLHVDRRGKAEIQDLCRDVARQESEGGARIELWQLPAQAETVVVHRRGIVLQADGDVAILRADRAAGAVGLVDSADRQPAIGHRCWSPCPCRMCRIDPLTSTAILAASSSRVPTGARMCMSISPDLMHGKKSRPRKATRPSDANAVMENTTTNLPRCAHDPCQRVLVGVAEAVEAIVRSRAGTG